MEEDCSKWKCSVCGNEGMQEFDGFYYCQMCNSQADDVIQTGVADEDFVEKGCQSGALYLHSFKRQRHQSATPIQPISQVDPQSQQFWSQFTQDEHGKIHGYPDDVKREKFFDSIDPTGPSDFPSDLKMEYSYDGYYKEVRKRYVMGMQMMIEAQCESLVDKFNANPLICGIVAPIWLRFVARTGIFSDGWADETIHDSEIQNAEELPEFKPRAKYRQEPHNIHGKRAITIWLKYLRRKLPLSCSLAVSYLGCHIAKESILPTDIVKWSVEGKLTYFDAFVEIKKRMVKRLPDFPLSLKDMFRPSQAVSAQQLESLAASIAQSVGLNLPSVNFYAIASRYLRELSLPVEKILPHASQIHEWVMPPELWLSTNGSRLPTQVSVMSILIIAIRILYNINGFGVWERSLSNSGQRMDSEHCHEISTENCYNSAENGNDLGINHGKKSLCNHKSDFGAEKLLHTLEGRYHEIHYSYEYSKDLQTFLNYCKDVVFAGLEPPLEFYQEENSLIDQFWQFYQKEKEAGKRDEARPSVEDERVGGKVSDDERTSQGCDIREQSIDASSSRCSDEHGSSYDSGKGCSETFRERAIQQLKINMEENNFCYIPPRVKPKRYDYLHYVRKKDEGALTYVAHADYYILLRACARVAQVDVRIMHVGVLSLERRLAWVEQRIDHSLHSSLSTVECDYCRDLPSQILDDDPIGLSDLCL